MNSSTINANFFIIFTPNILIITSQQFLIYINVCILYIMVDQYWKKIKSVENDIENSMQISSILLKLKGYDEKLSDLSKIGNNENSILSNLGIINTSKNDVSSNLGKLNTNKSNILSNLEIINTNKNIISSNLGIVNTNKNDISFNLNQINNVKSVLPTLEIFKKTYSIKNQSFKFSSNIIYFKLLEMEIENNFNVDGKLEINSIIYYKYDKLQKDHHRLQHEYRIFDDKNNLFHKTILNKTNSTNLDFYNNIMYVKDNFYIKFKNNYNKIKIILYLYRVYRHGAGIFNLELINENFTNIAYLDKNDISLKIEKNKSNISSNLEKIDTNKNSIKNNDDDIAYNLREINKIKNTKTYLKNIYTILFYNKKAQIDFRNLFYEKVFDVNANKSDFIEMNFKIDLQYQDISERNYVITIYEIFDENDNSLYIKSTNINKYSYFSNRVIVDENNFYNFTKDVKKIKFVIKFQMLLSRVIKIWYIKNDNYRLIIKNYGL